MSVRIQNIAERNKHEQESDVRAETARVLYPVYPSCADQIFANVTCSSDQCFLVRIFTNVSKIVCNVNFTKNETFFRIQYMTFISE